MLGAAAKGFPTEALLQERLFREAYAIGGTGHCWVRREMPIGGRIPDIVIVSFDQAPPTRLWPRRFSFKHAAVMAILRRRPDLKIETIAGRCFDRIERISGVVVDLLRAGTIEERRPGVLRLSSTISDLAVGVTAIEAKLTRWSKALVQAQSYMPFADRVFVALDAAVSVSPKALSAFRSAGVGLWSTSVDGVRTLLPPRSQNTWTAEKEYVVASAIAARSGALWTEGTPSELVGGTMRAQGVEPTCDMVHTRLSVSAESTPEASAARHCVG